ncbi:alcohol dehydrogenase catalytic domain-containing protein [Streptomyces sp. NPDC004533]|uniref:alcohol dehydrogenase catalytic domain-containing protein n=1 Tax=Streptomyces sp. NPDC004533 TaxID=3154278 RepID=UPI0033BB63B1
MERTTIERRDVGEFDVLIDIKYAGICHSDIHQVDEGWDEGIFPMVPGHEIAGIVSEVGPGVTKFRAGDRVGVGCMVDSCRTCDNCKAGNEQYCTAAAWSAPTTTPARTPLDFSAYLSLKTDGALVNVGLPEEPISVDLFDVVTGRKTIAGSLIGGHRGDPGDAYFCAEHGIGAEIELIRADQINGAYKRVLASDVRYRFVIDTATI